MRIHRIIMLLTTAIVLSGPSAKAADSEIASRIIENIPFGQQDTALRGDDADQALKKAAALATISSPVCTNPKLSYSTIPLSKAAGEADAIQETEIWYFHCPEVTPVAVHYTRSKTGTVGNIHVHEFDVFMHDLPLRPLALKRNPAVNFKTFPKRSAINEAICFGLLSGDVEKLVSKNTPRLRTEGRGQAARHTCLRMLACNSIEPDLDILQDITLREETDSENINFASKFTAWCNSKDQRALVAEEPEFSYGLMRLLPKVPELTDKDEEAFRNRKKAN